MSPDKSCSNLLVRSEMSTSTVMNAAYSSLWSSIESIHEIQPSCFFHITFLEKLLFIYMIVRKFYQQRSPFLSSWAQKGRGITKTMCTDLLIKVRHRHISWDQVEKSACVSLSPTASPFKSIGSTPNLSHCLQPRAGIAGQENIARSSLVWEDLDWVLKVIMFRGSKKIKL